MTVEPLPDGLPHLGERLAPDSSGYEATLPRTSATSSSAPRASRSTSATTTSSAAWTSKSASAKL